jgi:hypothetical protein
MLISLLLVVDSRVCGCLYRMASTNSQAQQYFGSCVDHLATFLGRDHALLFRHDIGESQTSKIQFYTQSQATRDFIEVCSNPLTQEFNSSIAIHTFLTECNLVQNRMNADIGGIGIRISLYISLVVTILSSFAGHFHQE